MTNKTISRAAIASIIVLMFIIPTFYFYQFVRKSKMPMHPPDSTYAFRLKPGDDLFNGISEFVRTNNIQAGYVITCVGSLTQYNLRFANQPEGTVGIGHFEIVSLTGTISINGSHLHISLSDSTGKTIGGHLLPGNIIYTTAEIVIGENNQLVFKRVKDGTTPWEELDIRQRD